jgi:ankyrin repeat protein
MDGTSESGLERTLRDGTVQLLLEREAKVGARDEDGRTALHGAALNGREGVMKLLEAHDIAQ